MVAAAFLLAGALAWVWKTDMRPERVTLFVTAVIGALTAVYALFTYEILLQNRTMAKAALDSSNFMERSLRFSHTANLIYLSMNTKDPTFKSSDTAIAPIDNPDYKRALTELREGGEQKEFVFAVIHNKGQGAATAVTIDATYNITDSSSPNRDTTVTKRAAVQILEPNKAVALCVFIAKLPTPDDAVTLVEARLSAGDFYRDAIGEPPQQFDISPRQHHTEAGEGCVVRLV